MSHPLATADSLIATQTRRSCTGYARFLDRADRDQFAAAIDEIIDRLSPTDDERWRDEARGHEPDRWVSDASGWNILFFENQTQPANPSVP